jgi:hypothetical protein
MWVIHLCIKFLLVSSVDPQMTNVLWLTVCIRKNHTRCFQYKVYSLCTLSICLWLYNPCGPWLLFQFLNLYTVGRTPWRGINPVARPLPTHGTKQTQNKRRQTSMPRVGLEPTIPVLQRKKTVHALTARPLWSAKFPYSYYKCFCLQFALFFRF